MDKNGFAGRAATGIAQVEADAARGFAWCILEMGRLIEGLVVVDAKYFSTRDAGAQPADLGREIARPDVSKHRECREAVKIRHAHANGRPVNLRIFPSDREEDGRVAERAEVIRVVCVLPQVVGIDDHELSKGLLKAGI